MIINGMNEYDYDVIDIDVNNIMSVCTELYMYSNLHRVNE